MAFSISDLAQGNCLVSLMLSEVLIQMETQDLYLQRHATVSSTIVLHICKESKKMVLYELVSRAVMNCLGSLNFGEGKEAGTQVQTQAPQQSI
jgi:hypothetical protein